MPKSILVTPQWSGKILCRHYQCLLRTPFPDRVSAPDRIWRQVAMMGVQQHDVRAVVESARYTLLGFDDIDWSDEKYASREAIFDACKNHRDGGGDIDARSGWVQMPFRFRNCVRQGDIVIASKGNQQFRAIGEFVGDYEFKLRPERGYAHRRAVRWLWVDRDGVSFKRLDRLIRLINYNEVGVVKLGCRVSFLALSPIQLSLVEEVSHERLAGEDAILTLAAGSHPVVPRIAEVAEYFALLAVLTVAIKGIHRPFDLWPCEKVPRLDVCGKAQRRRLPMTAIAISVNNHARCTALTVEHMIDAETKKCRIFIGDENTLFNQTVSFGPVALLIGGSFPHRG
ncbi:hypothetical protein ACFQXB_13590 [Plastorhodobacter daqingensis]|uniref:Restriction endonuclease n=1 Tax=Plastorhodobacter daqingensis TaxID=1387281 RepID=A0ABW2UQF6_9RHOB